MVELSGGGRHFGGGRELAVFVCAAAAGVPASVGQDISPLRFSYRGLQDHNGNWNCAVVKMAANGKESSELTLTVLGCGTSLSLIFPNIYRGGESGG
jgi:hypothetical protein